MKRHLQSLLGAGILLGAAVVAPEAIAQDGRVSIAEQFERAFFQRSETFYENRSIFDDIGFYLLPSTYPEGQITSDAQRIHNLYEVVLEIQTSSDPVIRTPDLNNPFDESLLTSPSYPPDGIIYNP